MKEAAARPASNGIGLSTALMVLPLHSSPHVNFGQTEGRMDGCGLDDLMATALVLSRIHQVPSSMLCRGRSHFGIEQPVALVFSYKANVTDSNET